MSRESANPTVALVTGANQGIGYEIAKRLASEHPDYHVFMAGRRKEAIEKAASELQEAGLNVEPLVLDITSDDNIDSAVDTVRTKFGRLDVLINNAGILLGKPDDSIRQKLATVYNTNVFGSIAVTDAFIPLLRESSKVKRVVFVSSGLGSLAIRTDPSLGPVRDFIEYGSSKAALNHAAMTFASRYRDDKMWKFNISALGVGAGADPGSEEEGAHSKDGPAATAAAGEKNMAKVWRPKKEGWVEGKKFGSYLSVNGYSVDAGQDGFDLREITEKKWVGYCDWLELHSEGSQGTRHDRPWEGGAY
ncbi:hypothetical protein COL5a_008553 [Colletotrichum fioriniae]|nr:uncharacterized protein COL516b_008108 [Colletotrichum fioriniae]KAJ0300933.1 hypothetical protein COL516b_008108 [Colletotrichum fioriniae]KAJ0322729.1 hypothetical protein COL5a_008553 [Colletotrichum fioriniae]